jgi:electron transport complex protein RnfB
MADRKGSSAKLVSQLNSKGSSLPLMECEELSELLGALYSEEEAEFLSCLPVLPFSLSSLSEQRGEKDLKQLGAKLEQLADRGQLHSVRIKTGETFYTVNTLIPGYLELCFMPGRVDGHREKLARLFDAYMKKLEGIPDLEIQGVWRFPFFRTLAVEKELAGNLSVQPYDFLSRYVEKVDDIAVGTCFCSQVQALTAPGGKPVEVCMTFGPTAQTYIERGFARRITKEEACRILEEAEQAGLVHCASNTGKYIDGLCNCNIRYCKFLQNLRKSVKPFMVAPSSFEVEYTAGDCTSCGACLDRCQMGALYLEGDTVVFNRERCIGCGLCISCCPAGCLRLRAREHAAVPPVNSTQLYQTMFNSMAKS